jgi:hypothetical protein
MNTITKIAVLTIVFMCGAGAHNFWMGASSNHLVKLEKTRSGTFVIENGKIFEVLELPTSKTSFNEQPQYGLEK